MKRLLKKVTPAIAYMFFWIGMAITYTLLFVLISSSCNAQGLHKIFKYSTVYAAVNGGTSLGDNQIWSVTSGTLEEDVIETPFDYTFSRWFC
jgi:hypothetical protein